MSDDQTRADIALIRAALEQGRAYASGRGADMIAWGLLVAAGYLATWAFAAGRSTVSPPKVWTAVFVLGWLFSLRRLIWRVAARSIPGSSRPMAIALRSLWLGNGICLTLTGIAGMLSGGLRYGWFDAFAAGLIGASFFTSAVLCDLGWMRWVAVVWWVGELAVFSLRGQIEVLPLNAALFLLLLAGPGIALRRRSSRPA